MPIATGNANESLLALVDGKFVNLRVPYPMGFYTKVDGRAHRRSERRLEGQGDLWSTYSHPDAVPHRRRQGDDEQGREVPASPRPAREVTQCQLPSLPVPSSDEEVRQGDIFRWKSPRHPIINLGLF